MNMSANHKANLGPGPWQAENDRVVFEAHGFPCILKRTPRLGHWCGYVGVPPGHPWHGKDFSTGIDGGPEVHGGVTYGKACDGDPVAGVCHLPKPGEPEHAWWVGFDFAHADDLSPGLRDHMMRVFTGDDGDGEHYWTEAEVRTETENCARQAAEVAL